LFEANFVAAHQQVGDFEVVDVQGQLRKRGGNVAGYFLTPEGRVLHAVAGPVTADALLEAANWALNARQQAAGAELPEQRLQMSRLHLQALSMPVAEPGPQRAALLGWRNNMAWTNAPPWRSGSLSREQRIHLLLAHYPLASLDTVYAEVFENILNERIHQGAPHIRLAERGLALAATQHRPLLFVLHDSREHAVGYEQWLAYAGNRGKLGTWLRATLTYYVVIVLPIRELPALSQRLGQPPFRSPGSLRPLLVVARSNGEQLASVAGFSAAPQLVQSLAAGLADATQRHPPGGSELRPIIRLIDSADPRMADPLRRLARLEVSKLSLD
jgi:hypothetical protein